MVMFMLFTFCFNPVQGATLPDDGRLETDAVIAEQIRAAAAPFRSDSEAEDRRQPE